MAISFIAELYSMSSVMLEGIYLYILKACGRAWIIKYMKHEHTANNSSMKFEALRSERKVWVQEDNSQ